MFKKDKYQYFPRNEYQSINPICLPREPWRRRGSTRTMAAARSYENHGGGAAWRNHIPWIEGGHVAWLTGCGAEDQRNSRGSSSVFSWKVCPSLHLPHIIFAVFYVQCAESADTHLRTWLQSSRAQPQLCQD
jgi:hypothetical protein